MRSAERPLPAAESSPTTRVYLDHNATSPLDPRIAEAMAAWSSAGGNPSSLHAVGRAAREVLENGRQQVATFLGAEHASEIVFGASGTELNNAVLGTVASQFQERRTDDPHATCHVVAAMFEHPSILAGCRRLAHQGVELTLVEPGPDGVVKIEAVKAALQDDTQLVALMLANNEIGTLQPVAEVARLCRDRGVATLCDAVQAAGKVPFQGPTLGVDYLVIAGHKFNGPIGAAALWVRPSMPLEPLLVGGSQERGRRAGTENVAANAGLGLACELAGNELEERWEYLAYLRDLFEENIVRLPGVTVHCASSQRLPNTSSVRFDGLSAQDLLIKLDLAGFAVSTGSACASGSVQASPTLLSLGLSPSQALSTIRVSFGLTNTRQDVEPLVEALQLCVEELRGARQRFSRDGSSSAAQSEA